MSVQLGGCKKKSSVFHACNNLLTPSLMEWTVKAATVSQELSFILEIKKKWLQQKSKSQSTLDHAVCMMVAAMKVPQNRRSRQNRTPFGDACAWFCVDGLLALKTLSLTLHVMKEHLLDKVLALIRWRHSLSRRQYAIKPSLTRW